MARVGRFTEGDGSAEAPVDGVTRVDAARLVVVERGTENLTHDMNNALMSLSNYAEIAGLPNIAAVDRAVHLGRIAQLTDEVADLVKALRLLACLDDGEFSAVDLEKVVYVSLAASRAGLRHVGLSIDLLPIEDLPLVRSREADAMRLLVGALHAIGESIAAARGHASRLSRVKLLSVHDGEDVRVTIDASEAGVDARLDPASRSDLVALAARAAARLDVSHGGELALTFGTHARGGAG